jgi:hypothetical protein
MSKNTEVMIAVEKPDGKGQVMIPLSELKKLLKEGN